MARKKDEKKPVALRPTRGPSTRPASETTQQVRKAWKNAKRRATR
jgi:hypothetical protein